MTIDDIGTKVENDGINASGRLSAEEFNTLLDAVKSHDVDIDNLDYEGITNLEIDALLRT